MGENTIAGRPDGQVDRRGRGLLPLDVLAFLSSYIPIFASEICLFVPFLDKVHCLLLPKARPHMSGPDLTLLFVKQPFLILHQTSVHRAHPSFSHDTFFTGILIAYEY